MKLREDQEKAVEKVIKALKRHKAAFLQAPTGWGKTATAVALANHYHQEGKNVIIATVRNDLVSQFYQTILKMGTVGDPTVVVGKSNYIVLDSAIDELKRLKNTPMGKGLELSDVLKFLINESKTGKEYIFASDVEREHAGLADTDIWNFIKFAACATEDNNIPSLEDTPYVITNIFYLVSYLIYTNGQKRELNPNTVVLLDEVDYYAESVRNFFFTGFSLHSIKAISAYMGIETDNKIYTRLAVKAENARDKASRLSKIDDTEILIKGIYDILKKTFSKKLLKDVLADLYTPTPSNTQRELYEQVIELQRFIRDVESSGPETASKNYNINFSAVRKYPKIRRQGKTAKDARDYLSSLWKKMTDGTNRVVGFGATISPDFTPELNRGEVLLDVSKRLTLPGGFDFKFIALEDFAERKRKNIVVYLSDKTAPHYTYSSSKKTEEWVNYIADTVQETYKGGSAMIICKARETSQYIAEALIKRGLNIVYDQSADMKKTLSAFRNRNNILVAHSGLGVGMDVPDIKQLYVTQLPFAQPKTEDNAKRDFVQWIGRLREDEKEEKELYILDSRIHNDNKKSRKMLYELKHYYKKIEILGQREKEEE